jgi:hypothetical protein
MAKKKVLDQTKGQFKLMGKVKGIQNENALKEGVTRNDDPFKSLSFFVETSPTNAIKVELFAMERDEVYFYSSKAKESKKVKWAKRNDSIKEFKLIGIRMGLEKGAEGKNKIVQMVEWDAIDYIMDNLKDGDSVFVNGSIDFQEYKDNEGNMRQSKRYTLNGISKTKKPVDFDAEDFSEMASFEQDIVVTDVIIDEGKLMVGAKIIGYAGKNGQSIVDTTFIVDPEADGGKYKKLANNMKTRFKYGDAIKVFGLCINAVELQEAEVEEEEDDWGGEMPAGQGDFIRNYINELRITAVDSSTYEPKKYTEDDFYSEGEDSFGDDDEDAFDEGDDFGGEDTGIEDDDDLPFA